MRSVVVAIALAWLAWLAPSPAQASGWNWLRSKNGHVERGNEKMKAGDAKAALAEYDKAARELPAEGGVHLNRGLALMQTGDTAAAREALRLASQPPASPRVRADAAYDLGLGFYGEADTLAGEEKHEEAQAMFREAADAFRDSLRLRPGNRDAAWNLELALRRIREQEEKQKQKEEESKKDEEQKDEQQKQDEQNQDQQKQDEQNQDPQDQKPQQDEEKQEQEKQKQDQQKQDQQKQDEQKQDEQKQEQEKQEAQPLPADIGRALDALQDSEENLERMKARMRAQRERRAPEKDW